MLIVRHIPYTRDYVCFARKNISWNWIINQALIKVNTKEEIPSMAPVFHGNSMLRCYPNTRDTVTLF